MFETDDSLQDASVAARSGALVVGRSRHATIEVTGVDRVSWLNAIVTCDVTRVSSRVGAWGLLLTKQGKIVTDLCVVSGGERLVVGVHEGQGRSVLEYLDRMLIMEDAELRETGALSSWFALHGPAAPVVAERVASEFGGAWGSIDWTGLGGAGLVVPSDRVEAACDNLAASPGVRLAIADEWLQLRLERGLPEMGDDFGSDDTPHQAALERRAVAWDKGCYLGQEVVCMVDMRGKVRRRLACLLLDERVAPARETAVVASDRDQPIGNVTSSVVSPRLGKGIAMARLLVTHSAPGMRVFVDGVAATVSTVPDES